MKKKIILFTNQTNHLVQDHDHSKIYRDHSLEYMVKFDSDTIFLLIVYLRLILSNRKNNTEFYSEKENFTVKSVSVNRIRLCLFPRCN